MRLKNTRDPVYMVLLNENHSVQELNKNFCFIGHTRIRWAYYRNKKIITQCKRCQEWGHATTNCNAKYVCLKCGEQHASFECKQLKSVPPKCANCLQPHPANSTECIAYKEALAKTQKGKQKNKPGPNSRSTNESKSTNNKLKQVPHYQAIKEFPKLPACDMSSSAIPLPTTIPNAPKVPPTNTKPNFESFNDLMAEINILHQTINITRMLQLVKDLNNRLVGTTTTAEKFHIFITFTQSIHD
ncbi:uncharacterized protein [Atheta coriaria]|uniref:uncharacterized protein n=1 Tax=Dalotia coriaria TaxID=877792 RepID=UPI0031F41BC9